jgi:ectoine hydroxylase-related dioxygenase (phytanoyl-CoA dioxygenase family)
MKTQLTREHALTLDEIKFFHQNGYLGPFTLIESEDFKRVQNHLEDILFGKNKKNNGKENVHNRHLIDDVMLDISLKSTLADRITSLLGDDALLWRTNFFNKDPGGKEIPWHQDYNYWPLEPSIVVSAWVACDDVDTENSCVQIIPQSHRKILPHISCIDDKGLNFGEKADPTYFQVENVINMELKAGQFFLFNERLLHHSFTNTSNRRRLGLAIRSIAGITEVMDYDSKGHVLYPLGKANDMGINKLAL